RMRRPCLRTRCLPSCWRGGFSISPCRRGGLRTSRNSGGGRIALGIHACCRRSVCSRRPVCLTRYNCGVAGARCAPSPPPGRAAGHLPVPESMTTLVVVRKNSAAAIAADSLTTFGDTRLSAEFDRTYDKIVDYKGTYIGLCGSAAHQLVFESLLAKHDDLDFSTKRSIFE